MSKCFAVIHQNYAEGTDSYAFWSKDAARKSVEADVNVEFTSLRKEGYKPVILHRIDGATVYVPDSDIYYEWEILETTIEGAMQTLGDRDKELEQLWEQFGDIPMDETECIEECFEVEEVEVRE